MDDPSVGRDVVEKLDLIVRLLAHQVAMQHETLETKAVVLSSLGLGRAEIAKVCGTTPNTVSVRLAEAKKKNKRSGRAKGRADG